MESINTLNVETELIDGDFEWLDEEGCFTAESDQENGEMPSAPSNSISVQEEKPSENTQKEAVNMTQQGNLEMNAQKFGQQDEVNTTLEAQKEVDVAMEQSEMITEVFEEENHSELEVEVKATIKDEEEEFEKFEISLPQDDDSLDNLNDISLDGFQPTRAKASRSRSVTGAGGFSVINNKNSRRITLSPNYYHDVLGSPETIQIAVGSEGLIIGEKLGAGYPSYKISKKYRAVYHAELVNEITDKFSLDYSERTSYSFDDIKVSQLNSSKVLFVCIK